MGQIPKIRGNASIKRMETFMAVTKIENKENVKEIKMYPTACVKCKIGKDWYSCKFEVFFCPNTCYPDYMQVDQFVQTEIDGKELNIEEAAKLLYDYLKTNYEPWYLRVSNHVTGCKVHFDVLVTVT